jgi:hypothetical protein
LDLRPSQQLVSCRAEKESTHEKENENGGVHQNEAEKGAPPVADASGDRAGEKHADESTTLAGLEEGALPLGLDLVVDGSFWIRPSIHAVSLLESTKRDKVGVEKHVEGFHDLRYVRL